MFNQLDNHHYTIEYDQELDNRVTSILQTLHPYTNDPAIYSPVQIQVLMADIASKIIVDKFISMYELEHKDNVIISVRRNNLSFNINLINLRNIDALKGYSFNVEYLK